MPDRLGYIRAVDYVAYLVTLVSSHHTAQACLLSPSYLSLVRSWRCRMSIRQGNLGVTSLARALTLRTAGYESLLGNMHSQGICLSKLTHCWVRCVFQLFGLRIERVNDRVVLIADGKKIAKQGHKMPAVKCLHQESDNHSKPAFIMGHSTQAVSLLVNAVNSAFAVPLDIKIHEGLVFSNRSKQTLLDKLIGLIGTLD